PLSMAGHARQPCIDDQTRAILHESMTDEAQLRLHARPLAVEPGIRIGRAAMRLVAALLSLEIRRGVAPAARAVPIAAVPRIFRLEPLHRSPGFNQSAIDREMLARQQPLDAWLSEDGGQEFGCDLAVQQPIAVLGEGRMIPHRIIDADPD